MKIKICHITTIHPAKDTRIFYKECKSLAKNGFDVNLIVINGESFTEDDVEVFGVPCKFSGRLQRFYKASKTAYKKALEINADIYHFHDPEFLPFGARLVNRGKKVIYDVHEDLPRQMLSKYWIPLPFRKSSSKIIEVFENKYAGKMSCIITATSYIKERFLKFHNNVIEVQNFPIIEFLQDSKEVNKTSREACYVGSIAEVRGISELIKSLTFAEDNIRLNLAGKFNPENYRNELKQISGWEKVIELGFIDPSQIKDILQRSFVGIVTLHPIINYLNALPVKMFEYMAASIPVIASDFPILKEIIESNKCGICVDPLNPEEIADAINYLFNNPDKANEMGMNGLKAVKEIYNWAQEEKKLIKVYRSLYNE
ncbi:MAG: glycosyltransferase family 4 protein [Bacteroidales bacterium]|nr:glycosyltransferase family 4 protein [Bacteroidales bacterium]